MGKEGKELKTQKKNFLKDLWHKCLGWNFKRKPGKKKFEKLPDDLQRDFEIRYKLVKKYPDLLYDDKGIEFSDQELEALLERDKGFWEWLAPDKKQRVLLLDVSYLEKCTEAEKVEFVERCIKLDGLSRSSEAQLRRIGELDPEFQRKLLTKELDKKKEIKPEKFWDKLQYFSVEVVKNVIEEYLKIVEDEKDRTKAKNDDGYEEEIAQKKYAAVKRFLSGIVIEKLPVEAQMEIVKLDETQFIRKMSTQASQRYAEENVEKDTNLVKLMSTEAVKSWVGDNPMLLKYLSLEQLKQILPQRIEYLDFVDSRNLIDILQVLNKIQDVQIPDEYKISYPQIFGADENIKTVTPFKKMIANGLYNIEYSLIKYPLELTVELAEFAPEVIGKSYDIAGFEDNREEKQKQLIDAIKSKVESFGVSEINAISSVLDDFQARKLEGQKRGIIGFNENMLANISKVLLNRKVVKTLPSDILLKFIRNPNDRNALKEIIGIVYGEDARKQLEKHPDVTINEISCLDIFDPVIIQKFGEGTLSNMLAYESIGSLILADLVRHPDEMEKFEAFKNLFGVKADDIFGFNNKLMMFSQFKELFAGIDFDTLTQSQKDTLILIYNDYFMMKNSGKTQFIKVATLEDIDSYEERRNKMFGDYLQKATQVEDIKSAITARFFGMEYDSQGHYGNRDKENMHFEGMFRYYCLESFLTDDRTIQSDLFTSEELDMLEIASIIKRINDPNVLKRIYEELESRTDVLRPIDFTEAKSKIPLQYSKELVNSLLTVENAKERVANKEDGIKYEVEDGIEIIRLEGAGFNVMSIPQQDENRNGVIGGKIIDGNMASKGSPAFPIHYNDYEIVYFNLPPEQVVTMERVHPLGSLKKEERNLGKMGNIEAYGAQFFYPDNITGNYYELCQNPNISVRIADTHISSESPEYGERLKMKKAIFVNGKVTDKVKAAAIHWGEEGKPIPIIALDISKYGFKAKEKSVGEKGREEGAVLKEIRKIVEIVEEDQR